ncbi:hypothetical protein [Bacillus gaemokensis]|uniref:Uncharacterized protein n=1 Tax=Bacillus gaemokensis TaxID=574375 RepID=A0A073KC05_9BACI|nr:hypothetical protein [Bacillus gaemokensis]KEK23957.1 hypothetical protein BAGA_05940 [Bacillus gaemokensis]KYG38078.1 hypothetical protein AZF08_20180 [Bacillus gaemokensis]
MEQYQVKSNSIENTLNHIAYLFNGHNFGETHQDLTIVLDRRDALELLKDINTSGYEEVSIKTEGEYLIISSSVECSAFFVENIYTEDGRIKLHETDILILPYYLPQAIREKFLKKGDCLKVIELTRPTDIYQSLVEIINK